jgi:hypothetical protein
MLGVLARRGAVVLADLVVGAEQNGFWLDRWKRPADRPAVADDPDP